MASRWTTNITKPIIYWKQNEHRCQNELYNLMEALNSNGYVQFINTFAFFPFWQSGECCCKFGPKCILNSWYFAMVKCNHQLYCVCDNDIDFHLINFQQPNFRIGFGLFISLGVLIMIDLVKLWPSFEIQLAKSVNLLTRIYFVLSLT